MMRVITEDQCQVLESLKKALYSENRLSADQMRDWADRLRLILEQSVEIDEGDIKETKNV